MKTGIVVTLHNHIERFGVPCVRSLLEHTPEPRFVIVYDNESTDPDLARRSIEPLGGLEFVRVDDQRAGGGLTGTWNRGVQRAREEGCDRVVLVNHDVVVNETWASFCKALEHPLAVYGPLADDPGDTWRWQQAGEPTGEVMPVRRVNGFCMGMSMATADTVEQVHGYLFDETLPFGGNETEFQKRLHGLRGLSWLWGATWVHHFKNHAWRGDPKLPDAP